MKRLFPWLVLLLLMVPLVVWLFDAPDAARVADGSRNIPPPILSPPLTRPVPLMPPGSGDSPSAGAAPGVAAGPGTGLPDPMRQELESITRRDGAGLVEEVMPDGAVRLRLQQRFRQAPIAVIDESGELHVTEY